MLVISLAPQGDGNLGNLAAIRYHKVFEALSFPALKHCLSCSKHCFSRF